MKSAVPAFLLLALLATPALAGSCADDLKALDATLAGASVPADVKAQVKDMRSQAEKLCQAGNEEEAADVLSEANAMLAAPAQ